ncbi:MAG TPA: UDP-N-acetylmuramoyl-tripeptide--D-alanyl-D-alanine ligase [Polyangia bacterium]|nr:UDP-N-acetylmuramoyl-tripeptide--D-alanyl-D-alanine ligase [Polyangia bacterium]
MKAPVDIGLGLDRVLSATGGALVRPSKVTAEKFSAVVIDGREVPRGALFFAIQGDRFDGHDFVAQAVAGGADGVVVARGRGAQAIASTPASFAVVEVDDPIAALGKLARAHRESMSELKVVGIAGSNGKTTTKEITAAILRAAAGEDAVLKTEGNLNNHLGVPLTLLRLSPRHRFAVVEMGMSALGELSYLASIGRPDVAVIVSIADEHLEHLGSIENVARAEAEILEAVVERGQAVVPVDEPLLAPYVTRVPAERRLTFGPRAAGATCGIEDVTPRADGLTFSLHLRGLTSRSGVQAHLPLVGAHNASNAAAAAAAALALDVGEGPILDGMEHVKPAKHRAQLVAAGDRTVLDDCYNASPLSMRAALDALDALARAAAAPEHKRVAVLGDMLELGPDAPRLHAELGAYAAARVDQLIAFGPLSRALADAARERLGADRVLHTDDPHDAAERALAASGPGDVILVKASRGMRLERVIDLIVGSFAAARGGG